jgi:acylphosphatase
LKKKAERLKLTGWSKSVNDNNVTLVFWDKICAIPELSLAIEASLNFTLAVYNWLLPDEHTFYLTHKRSV